MKKLLIFWLVVVCFFSFSVSKADAAKIEPQNLAQINELWQNSAHSLANVNCSSCHLDSETKKLVTKPSHESCQSCHEVAVDTFLLGKHGIRINEGMSPLTPAMASLPMKESALGKQMTCNSCHNVHSVNTYQASVDACLSCHNDSHSLNYQNSKHSQLFLAEGTLPRPSIESVTCATCHLPRQDFAGVIHVNHNNTYNLLPRDRMVKDVCMNCHSMEYSYNSIFDDRLVEENFNRPPNQELETLSMIHTFQQKRLGNK